MKNSECMIEQYRSGRLIRTFTPSGDTARPWRMEVNGKSYLRTNGWVLSKVLPTLVDGSRVTTRVVPLIQGATMAECEEDGRERSEES
ncbi:MAG TPA: hypothetical protein ENN10_05720 [Actinobacteria bacterium]|mgnify:CR=1 FL=1|nr:hypothetical protein [Actinomycetota bacterium]